MSFTVGIGARSESFDLPEDAAVDVMCARSAPSLDDSAKAIAASIEHPIGTKGLDAIVGPHDKICIIVSDVTRPVPTAEILPVLMEHLHTCGVCDENVTVAIALGSHRPQTDAELAHILGCYYHRLCVVNGDSKGLVHVGETRRGTPVDICAEVLEADVRIAIGNVEYHYFAGYSGGAKAVMPGMSTFEAIQANHSLMVDPSACAGNVDSPVRLDVEEACDMVGLEFIINVVLDEQKHIVYCASGDVIEAHRDACRKLDELYGCVITHPYDIVIASQGGSPKDLNLYQTQKALDNAKYAVRDGGVVVLVGSCAEGLGQETFEEWMVESANPQEVIDRLRERFKLGGHKAAAMAQVMQRARVFLVSDLPDELVRQCFMTPFATVQAAVDSALSTCGSDASVLVMPHAGSTLPLPTFR